MYFLEFSPRLLPGTPPEILTGILSEFIIFFWNLYGNKFFGAIILGISASIVPEKSLQFRLKNAFSYMYIIYSSGISPAILLETLPETLI